MGARRFLTLADLILLITGMIVCAGTVSRASENPRPSGAWTGQPQESSRLREAEAPATVAGNHDNSERPDVAAMRSDLQKMKALVNQMQVNLGFVQNAETPLKHQFEIEIEMWQMLLNQMERRLDGMKTQESSAPR